MKLALVIVLIAIILQFTKSEDCVTEKGDPCVFPFRYQGSVYNQCTNVTDGEGRLWCATETDEDGNYIQYSKKYGYCQESCLKTDFSVDNLSIRRIGSEETSCPSGEQCVENSQCSFYERKREELFELAKDGNRKAYTDLQNELRDKICNIKKRKICCNCPCLQKEECPSVKQLYKEAKKNVNTLRSLVCNRKARTFYCCDDKSESKIVHEEEESSSTYLPSAEKEECGFPDLSFIGNVIGGEDTEPGQFPYTALLGYHSDGKIEWQCAGTLINRWYVLTAAHCQGNSYGSRIARVRLGEWFVEGNSYQTVEDPLPDPQDFVIGSDMVTVHENYQTKAPFNNDIALVRLPTPAMLNRGVQIACLPFDEKFAARSIGVPDLRDGLISNYASVVGWGYTEYDPLVRGKQGDFLRAGVANQVQQQLELPIISAQACTEKFDNVFSPIDSQICAGGEIGRDSCKGDSGGPLYMTRVTESGHQKTDDLHPRFLIGIVSFGSKECGSGRPGVYTRITEHIGWIKRKIRG